LTTSSLQNDNNYKKVITFTKNLKDEGRIIQFKFNWGAKIRECALLEGQTNNEQTDA